MKRPAFQFYPGDWLQDAALRVVSVGARGLWMEMICLMHQGSDYGYLKVNHKVILPANLARMCGATLLEVEGWLVELSEAGVYSIDDAGCIFSRRMIRDEEIREARAAGGKKGGNPKLMGANKVNNKVDSKVNLKPNLPPTPSSSSSSSNTTSQPDASARNPEKFQMRVGWQPSDHLPDMAKQAGVAVTAAKLAEFTAHWLTQPHQRTQAEWDKALLQSAQHDKLRATSPLPAKGRPAPDNFAVKDYGTGVNPL